MRRLLTLALAGLCALPVYHTYRLNQDVAHLRVDPNAAPFFAYHRYGVAPQSVVFNVTSDICSTSIDAVVPTFLGFVRSQQGKGITEIRLAWQGATIAVLELPVASSNERRVLWDGGVTVAALARAVHCTPEGQMTVDWRMIRPEASVAI